MRTDNVISNGYSIHDSLSAALLEDAGNSNIQIWTKPGMWAVVVAEDVGHRVISEHSEKGVAWAAAVDASIA